jgi:hypothetical protein
MHVKMLVLLLYALSCPSLLPLSSQHIIRAVDLVKGRDYLHDTYVLDPPESPLMCSPKIRNFLLAEDVLKILLPLY